MDIDHFVERANRIKEELGDARAQLARLTAVGDAHGSVTATVSGIGELVGLRIDPTAKDDLSADELADAILAAVREAAEEATVLRSRFLEPMTMTIRGLGQATG